MFRKNRYCKYRFFFYILKINFVNIKIYCIFTLIKNQINMNRFPNLTKIVGKDKDRPQFHYAYIKEGYIYATDAHIAVKISLEDILDTEEEGVEYLEGKAFDLAALTLLSKSYTVMKIKEKGIVCYPSKGKSVFVRYSASNLSSSSTYYLADDEEEIHSKCTSLMLPDIESVLPKKLDKESKGIPVLCVDLDIAQRLKSAIIEEHNQVVIIPERNYDSTFFVTKPMVMYPVFANSNSEPFISESKNTYVIMPRGITVNSFEKIVENFNNK